MNLTITIVASVGTVFAAALCWRFSVAPGWKDQRFFSYVALSAAAYSALNVSTDLGREGPWVVVLARVQLWIGALHVVAWLRYSNAHLGLKAQRWEQWYERILLVGGLLALLPTIAYRNQLQTHTFHALDFRYIDPVPTPFGIVLLAALLSVFALLTVRYLGAWVRGSPDAPVHVFALCAFLIMGVNDACILALGLDLPYLLDVGFALPVGAVTVSLTNRFAADAHDLHRLRQRLQLVVDERTRELGSTLQALHRAEKLAALGQLAAGVAHEVNSPLAVITANLKGLAEFEPCLSADSRESITDALVASGRVAHIARQLLDTSRVAASGSPVQSVLVSDAVAESVRTALSTCGDRVELATDVPLDLTALAQHETLVQVLVNLIVNGAQSIPEERTDGRVIVRGERKEGRVLIVVEDNGSGMTEEVLARIFEPFFSTKPFGRGTGLGLAISRGLVAAVSGDLRLESHLGSGTRALVDLAAGGTGRS